MKFHLELPQIAKVEVHTLSAHAHSGVVDDKSKQELIQQKIREIISLIQEAHDYHRDRS